ncbi:MAG: glycosyltransferase, partial [Chamaesiphon sp.]|nr:glycosyltransferase [Chamaesiphon sp.]
PIVVHTYHGLHYLNISQTAAKGIRQKIKREIFKRIDRFLLNYTDRIICVCRSDYDKAIAARVATVDRTSIVYNGIEIDKFSNRIDQKVARQIFGLNPTEFIFGNVGRLHEQKGHQFLLQAVAKMTNRAQVAIIGDGELRDELVMLTAKLEISDQISFLGARTNINEFLSAIDVFILPSLWEGQPIALLEALAIGKPCITSDVDGIPEIITDRVNGYLVQPKDVEVLTIAMDWAVENPDLLAKFASSGVSAISSKFLAQNMAINIGNIYSIEQSLKL